jgi:hypothetical protein
MKKLFMATTLVFFFAFMCLLTTACRKKNTPAARTFYYWKSVFSLTENDKRVLFDTLHVTKLYVKYFDVVWNTVENKALPIANLEFQTAAATLPISKLVPTVFIRNEVFSNMVDSVQLDSLARRVYRKIALKNEQNKLPLPVEIQIDCDWSAKTKDVYFCFLKKLKQQNRSIRLSATIRLHQVKYPQQTGVPPVECGMLMVYNMSDVTKVSTKNSILDLEIAKQYISPNSRYPLPLDIALPVFRWAALFRGNKLIGLLNNYTDETCAKTTYLHRLYLNDLKQNWWQCSKDTVIANTYWRRGDRLRIEGGSVEEVRAIEKMVGSLCRRDSSFSVALFHCDSLLYQYYRTNNLQQIYDDY